MKSSDFFSRYQSCTACDRFFRRRRGSTRKLVDAGLIASATPRPGRHPGTTTFHCDPTEVAKAFGGEVVQS